MTDEQLVVRTREGDLAAFNSLVARWEGDLYRFLRRSVRDREEAVDLCQEALVRAFVNLERLREGTKFRVWLYQIALNLCRDRSRSAAVRHPAKEFDETGAAELAAASRPFEAPDARAARASLSAILEQALDALPAEQREAILLREYQGLTSEEIGEVTGAPAATVRSRIFYGMKALRRHLAARGVGEEAI